MKIAYVVSRFPHLYQTFVRREIREVVARGHTVTVFPIARPPRNLRRVMAQQGSVPASVLPAPRRWRHIPHKARPIVGALLKDTLRRPSLFAKTIAALPAAIHLADAVRQGDFDHIHAHWSTYPASAAWIASTLTDVPFSFAFHAYDIYATRILVPQKIRAAAFAVANCRFTVETIQRLYPDARMDKVKLLYNGVDIPDALAAYAPCSPPPFVAIGQLVRTKGFSVLIEAWRQLSASGAPFRGVIVGDGPQRRSLEQQVGAAGLDHVVTLTGALDERETRRQLSLAGALVVPCLEAPTEQTHDGLPNVVIEAQANGIPVIGSNLYGIPDAIEDGRTGWLVRANDAAALAEAMQCVLRDPGAAAAMAQRAHAQAKSRFDIHQNVNRLLTAFESASPATRHGSALR